MGKKRTPNKYPYRVLFCNCEFLNFYFTEWITSWRQINLLAKQTKNSETTIMITKIFCTVLAQPLQFVWIFDKWELLEL